ncbi:MAG: hypothetical protein IPJ41_14465 [Phycisphaerales bacterium]|nr:hypothetical protein [Phycisphaerales bacterium]
MDPFRRVIENAREYLGKLTVSQKLLVASVGVIAAMGLFLAAQYTAKPDMIDLLAPSDGASQAASLASLQSAGIDAELKGGKLLVPAEYRAVAVAQLAQSGSLPNDTTLLFANLLDRQGFYYSKQQNDQMYVIALQNELSRVIQGFRDIREARVLLDVPEPQGLGRSVRTPTASAMVTTRSGRALEQGEVDAIAQLIAGARAGLGVDNVRVIDGSANRQRRPTSPDDVLPTTYLEHAAAVEEQLQRKLSDLLGYIRGVSIAVTAQVDVTRVQQQSVKYLPSSEGSIALPKKTTSQSRNEGKASGAAEAGVRPNSQGDISASQGGGNGSTFTEEQGDKEFEVGLGSETTTTQDPRGMPTLLAASVNVPRSFIVEQLKALAAEGAAEPTEAEVNARWETERVQIEDQIKPHLVTMGDAGSVEGKVVVSMIPMDLPPGLDGCEGRALQRPGVGRDGRDAGRRPDREGAAGVAGLRGDGDDADDGAQGHQAGGAADAGGTGGHPADSADGQRPGGRGG